MRLALCQLALAETSGSPLKTTFIPSEGSAFVRSHCSSRRHLLTVSLSVSIAILGNKASSMLNFQGHMEPTSK